MHKTHTHTHTFMGTRSTGAHFPLCINTRLVVQALNGYIRQEGLDWQAYNLRAINAKRHHNERDKQLCWQPGPNAEAAGRVQQVKGEAFRQWAAGDLSFSASPNAPKSHSPWFCNWASVVNVVLTALHAPVHPFPLMPFASPCTFTILLSQ